MAVAGRWWPGSWQELAAVGGVGLVTVDRAGGGAGHRHGGFTVDDDPEVAGAPAAGGEGACPAGGFGGDPEPVHCRKCWCGRTAWAASVRG